ncbi:MAG: hypothetical protein EOR04_25570 [Mesorhizobium sp.]|uniref:hypothetical protein n=1 Tax=Mesorhizobium sp. TaxID=1871066 RepID=UPI000FEA64A7|nr:hypothetical protein [Mesorhizobium sp.]RWP38937.1 MAG: hypothetical protein EOR04_25570 [Mesorhizobium sp.]
MANKSTGPTGIKISKDTSNVTVSGLTYQGNEGGTAIEIEKGSTGNRFENVSVTGGARVARFVDPTGTADAATSTESAGEAQGASKRSKGWSRAFEENWPFKKNPI